MQVNQALRHGDLIAAAQLGEPQALERLLRAARPDIRRYAQRRCLLSDVDDAVQETLLQLTRHIGHLRQVAAFSGWLIRIVQRECRRLGRVVLRNDPYDEATLENWLAARSDDDLRIDLVAALESLPEHYREIVLLRDFAEFSIQEIADTLDLSPAATKSRLHRAREMAREYLLG